MAAPSPVTCRHMVPSAVTVLDRVPLTPTGKLDRDALPPRPPGGARGVPGAAGPGRDGCGRRVRRRPRCERIGMDDSFFDLGGTSLLATGLVADLSARMGTRVSLQALFLNPTPAGLARRLETSAPDDVGAALAR
ncbi:hypothetical protein GS432_20480 [Rhodococcus hoagii]|nr:hypothetical protein [Prescottella equi]